MSLLLKNKFLFTANAGFHPVAFHNNNSTTTATISNVYKTYITPAVRVVQLQQRLHILAGSGNGSVRGINTNPEGITQNEDDFEDTELDM